MRIRVTMMDHPPSCPSHSSLLFLSKPQHEVGLCVNAQGTVEKLGWSLRNWYPLSLTLSCWDSCSSHHRESWLWEDISEILSWPFGPHSVLWQLFVEIHIHSHCFSLFGTEICSLGLGCPIDMCRYFLAFWPSFGHLSVQDPMPILISLLENGMYTSAGKCAWPLTEALAVCSLP